MYNLTECLLLSLPEVSLPFNPLSMGLPLIFHPKEDLTTLLACFRILQWNHGTCKILTLHYYVLHSSPWPNSLTLYPAMSCLLLYVLGIRWLAVFLIHHAVTQLYALTHTVKLPWMHFPFFAWLTLTHPLSFSSHHAVFSGSLLNLLSLSVNTICFLALSVSP